MPPIIPELTSDPTFPIPEQSWILHTMIYQFSYQTLEGSPIRMALV